jgi:metal-responsive CopG/Arc/MetJ family transcriptional regulator
MNGRMVLEFGPKIQAEIETLASGQEVSRTELIRKAVMLYLTLAPELQANKGRRLAITEGDKIVEKIVMA